ncbi:Ig-like domain-containing protein [Blattabacterium cuenoti]|uniref:Ig-like domain-containing protein n=1 Tax=Blattabacterium cuenoti TaxID=1653831 RepID=UPI00163CBE82|nr:Ig-like domain-containing protein [Blattabacterium cuenoti]
MNKLIFFLLLLSCANYEPLTGGKKDINTPIFLYSVPNNFSTFIKKDLKYIKIFFNEKVTLKDIDHIIINPFYLQKHIIFYPSSLPKEYITIKFKEKLMTNTTYSICFNNCIKDDREENILPYFIFTFSTGSFIDSIHIKGIINSKFKIKKNIAIILYNLNHTIQKPNYIALIDLINKKYKISYIRKGKYSLLCFNDENKNKIYEPNKKELIFFQKKIFLLENNKKHNINILIK